MEIYATFININSSYSMYLYSFFIVASIECGNIFYIGNLNYYRLPTS